jgi:hypothetical protein
VVSGGLSAETGGASGGSINVITRNGANDLHGDAFLFAQNGSLDARNPFDGEKAAPMLHRYRMGVAMGGRIIANRTFYYAAFEQEHNRGLEDSSLTPAITSAVNRALATSLYSFFPVHKVTDNFFPTSRAETEASAKVTHQLTTRNSAMLRYAFTANREAGDAFHTEGWTDPSARGSSFTRDHAVVGSLTTVIDPQSVGDFRFQIADRNAVLRTNDATGPGAEIEGLIYFGRPYEGNGSRTESHRQATYTYSRQIGRHLLKAGATLNHVHEDGAMADGFGGIWLFASLADFTSGTPFQFRSASGSPNTSYSVTNIGGFVQDHWSVAPNFTVDFGLRYDFESLPSPLHESTRNFSPRVGVAYHVAKSWVVRGGYGIFYDRYVLAALNRVLQKDGVNAFELITKSQCLTFTIGATTSGGGPCVGVAGVPVSTGFKSIYTADSALGTPYSQQTNFSVEHLLARDLTVTASYLYVRGIKLPRTRNINTLSINPLYAGIFQLENASKSSYNGATFSVNRRMANECEFSAAYTISRARDDASDFNEQPNNPLNLAPEWALSRQDQRHRFVANMLWELPIGDDEGGPPKPKTTIEKIFMHIELAPIFSVESGRPVNPLTGVDNGTLAYPLSARPVGFGRNSFTGPRLTNLDFRFLKFFPTGKTAHLDLVAEAFNLLNHSNVAQVNPFFGTGVTPLPAFLQPIAGTGPRRIQFSLDFEF